MQRKNEKLSIFKNNEKGITLIALIITIIVLIIVAGVAINMAIGEDGIITKSRLAKEKEEVSRLSEKLELQKANIRLDNNKSVTLDNFLDQLKLENIIEDIDIEETGEENSRYIEVDDKYIFLVTDLKNGDVKIEYEGKTGKLIPKIKGIEVTKVTTNSITVKVSAIRAEGGNYKYYIKNITDKKEYEVKETSKNEEYTFTSLEQNKEYKIQVEVTNKNGSVLRETEGNIKTTTVQELTSANMNFTYTPNYWTNETVTATVSLKEGITILEGTNLQTSKDAENWSNSTSQEFTENGYIYVRVWDGTNGGGYAVGEVSKIDKEAPKISYSNEEKVDIDTTINETYIKSKYTITDASETSITNIVVKNSSKTTVGTTLNGYDIYSVTYSVKDKAENTTNVSQKYITKPTGSMTLTNALPNASFESDIETHFNDEGVIEGGIKRTTLQKRTGNYSMYYSCENFQAFPIICYGDIGMQSEKMYIRGYTRATSDKCYPLIYVYEANVSNPTWTRISRGTVSNRNCSTTDWEMLSIVTNPSSDNYKYLQLQITQGNGSATGTIYWDDFMALILDSSTWSSTPTKAWLDKMIPYFVGTETISSW